MSLVDSGTTTASGVLNAVRELASALAERGAEIEAARRVPLDLLDLLIDAGCFRLLVPRSHGGLGADLATGLRVLESLARADGSVAWTVMIGGSSWCDVTGLPRATFDELFSRPDVIVAGVINPSGSVTADEEGYRVTGRWSFASGCEHADLLFGNCVEETGHGEPQLRVAVFSPDQVVIEDTWTTSGLRGTGSHHFRADAVAVPAHRTFLPLADEACLDEPIVRIPPPALYSLEIASVALGIARGALDDILALAAAKVPLFAAAALATNPVFQLDLASADTDLCAARALLYEAAESAWATAADSAADGGSFTLEQRARLRAAAVWATERAAAVVDVAYRSGGGSAIYADSPLQRRFRDMHALTQHFLVKRDTLTTVGAVLAGQEVMIPVF
jgi:alkylation response protein AidB-like acyl-CoA dehydrogenase